ncbi:MAG: hypothetical protein ABJH52_01270 [Henriciella sp.]
MTTFGPNGEVLSQPSASPAAPPDYSVPTTAKLKRVGLASFLCGMAACILVTLMGVTIMFLAYQIAGLFGVQLEPLFSDDGVLQGIAMATLMSAMNWYFGYFTIPAAWIAIAFSLGRLPRRGIVHPMPYYRWGAIWGAILVGGTTMIAAFFVASMNPLSAFGGLLMGALIGGGAGLICGAIFRGIVRPAEQVKRIQVEVF